MPKPVTPSISKTCNNPTNIPPYDGSATLLLDGFSVIRRSPNDVVIANPSFEASGTGQASPGYQSSVAGWVISGPANGCAINQSSGPFADNGTIPDGGNVLVLQSATSVSQVLNVIPGVNYKLSLYLNGSAGATAPAAQVQIGGATAFTGVVTPVGGANPYSYETYTFAPNSTNVTLVISNATDVGISSALLVDNVRLINQMSSINLQNPSFEQGYNTNSPHYGTIPGWNSSVTALGVNDASGPFWDNGGPVDSAYVGFIGYSRIVVAGKNGCFYENERWLWNGSG